MARLARTDGWQAPDLTGTTLVVQPHCHQASVLGFEADLAILESTGAVIDRVTGCKEDCARGLINDIALSGAVHEDGTPGFNLRVGGGLSTAPRFARWLDVFMTPEEAPEVIAGMTGIFRDAEENRKARGKARLKFLIDRIGPDGLREELEKRVGRPLRRGVPKAPGLSGEDHIGVLV